MNRRSRILIGASILAIGAVTFWLAATQAQPDVRQVTDVVARPDEHGGRYTLVGVPEPERIPVTTSTGMTLEPNPQWSNLTRRTVAWRAGEETRFSTHTLRVEARGGELHWSFRNETRRSPADAQLVSPAVEAEWMYGEAGQVFPVEAFAQTQGGPTRIWAYYGKAPESPLQPKPSQFKGHLMTSLPDGTAMPDGALVWIVEEYTAGCSSKFLPPETQAKYNVTAE